MTDNNLQPVIQSQEVKPEKHPGGRPRILQSVEAAEGLIDLYFKNDPAQPTLCGLAMGLGFEDRQSLFDYIARDDEFSGLIKKAITRIESLHEKRMYEGQPAGSIFWLKNRGWRDSHDVTTDGKPIQPSVVNFSQIVQEAAPIQQTQGENNT